MDTISFKMSSPAGDLLSMMPSFRQAYRLTGKKAMLYQELDVIGQGMVEIKQPFENSDGESIMMNKGVFDNLRPLLISQEYIADFQEYKGQPVDYNMDEIRLQTFVNSPNGSINRWPFYAFPQFSCDLSEKWLSVHKRADVTFSAILNFTSRYRATWINYRFLEQYKGRLLFSGLPNEHETFCKKWGLDIPLLKITDFYDLAKAINSCKFFLGNASMQFQIAEGLKCPRILEIFHLMPNVIPTGAGPAFDFYHQQAAELYIHQLFNK